MYAWFIRSFKGVIKFMLIALLGFMLGVFLYKGFLLPVKLLGDIAWSLLWDALPFLIMFIATIYVVAEAIINERKVPRLVAFGLFFSAQLFSGFFCLLTPELTVKVFPSLEPIETFIEGSNTSILLSSVGLLTLLLLMTRKKV